jgi:hypothetical protein
LLLLCNILVEIRDYTTAFQLSPEKRLSSDALGQARSARWRITDYLGVARLAAVRRHHWGLSDRRSWLYVTPEDLPVTPAREGRRRPTSSRAAARRVDAAEAMYHAISAAFRRAPSQ